MVVIKMEGVEMAEKLTMKLLSGELEVLRQRLRDIETDFERKLESAMEKATEKLKARIEAAEDKGIGIQGHGGAVDVDTRRRLIADVPICVPSAVDLPVAILSRTGWKRKWKLIGCCYRDG